MNTILTNQIKDKLSLPYLSTREFKIDIELITQLFLRKDQLTNQLQTKETFQCLHHQFHQVFHLMEELNLKIEQEKYNILLLNSIRNK